MSRFIYLCSPIGFHIEYDPSKEPGNRVRSLEILCTHCRVPMYEPVQDSMDYKVVMPSYLVTGGDGFSMIPEEMKKHDSGKVSFIMLFKKYSSFPIPLSSFVLSGDLDLSVVSNYISQRQRVYPLVEGRIKVWSSAPGLQGPTVLLILMALLWSFHGIMWGLEVKVLWGGKPLCTVAQINSCIKHFK